MKKNKKEDKDMLLNIIPILISSVALITSVCAAYMQYRYSDADYEYKRNPSFSVTGTMCIQKSIIEGRAISVPYLASFDFDFDELDNLEQLYGIAPDYSVEEIETDNIEKNLNDYFSSAFGIREPDIKNGNNWYYYRFIVFKAIDGELTMQVYLHKTQPFKGDETAAVMIEKADEVRLLEFEKGHIGNSDFDGERQIAAQYKEIKQYLLL